MVAVAARPVFYQSPLYRALAADPRVDLTVIFGSNEGIRPYRDVGFSREVVWDDELLDGYRYQFSRRAHRNRSQRGFLALQDWDVFWKVFAGKYDVLWIHGFSYLTMWLAMLAATLRRMPILIREEQTLLHNRPWPKRWLRALVLRTLFRRVHGLYIGTNNRDYFRLYGVPEERMFFTPYCVENSALRARDAEIRSRREQLLASFGLPTDGRPIVLFVGKLISKKQPKMLLEAYARVRARYACGLLLVGEGELGHELREHVTECGILDVSFAGFLNRSEIANAYVSADVFVLPSAYHETWGIVVSEAMNFALPIVVSDKVGCGRDLVEPEENGFVFGHTDAGALADALELLVAHPQKRRSMGNRSREMISGWDYELAVDGIVEACRYAMGHDPLRSQPIAP